MSGPSGLGRSADLALAERDRGIPALACLLDDDGLSALLGEAVRVTRIRYKPGTSVLAAFIRSDGGPGQHGWATARGAGYGQKLYDRNRDSARTDAGTRLLPLGPGTPETVVAVGGVDDDWRLRRALSWLRRHGLEQLRAANCPPSEVRVLRYKPERRLVTEIPSASGPIIVKTAARPWPPGLEPAVRARLAALGVPLLPELANESCARHGISASPRWGDGDLGDGAGSEADDGGAAGTASYRAGAALAALHQVRLPPSPPQRPAVPVATGLIDDGAFARQLSAVEAMVAAVFPELEGLAMRVRTTLLERLGMGGGQPPVLAHGDFSPDQVLVAGEGIRFIDFDRMTLAEPEADIGSFAAAEQIMARTRGAVRDGCSRTRHLTAGYQNASGSVSPGRVELWAACRMFSSCIEPFRDRRPDWPEDMGWQLERAMELAA